MDVKIKMIHPEAKVPTYGTEGAAAFDLYSVQGGSVFMNGGTKTFDTGLEFEIPSDHVMLVFSRSGHGFKNGVRLANCVGVIDADYRGEVRVKLTNDGPLTYHVDEGERVGQAMVLPVERVQFIVTEELSDTARGTGGYGSTGK